MTKTIAVLILTVVLMCFTSSCTGLQSSNQNVRVAYYGRVIDQNGSPIPDVKIGATVRHWYEPDFFAFALGARFVHLTTKTDSDGRFKLHGASGDVIGLDFQKQKYELEPGRYSFSPASGSFDSPVAFRMWPTNIHEHLITGEIKSRIVPDGRTYIIDIIKGTIAEGGEGDLKVWVKRPAQITYGKRYDWSCGMDVINGGLLAEADANSAMYSAPADGYTPSFQFEQKIGSGWGDTTGLRRFFVILNNGQEYGRITIELMAYYNDKIPAMIRLSYVINPSGSRVLY